MSIIRIRLYLRNVALKFVRYVYIKVMGYIILLTRHKNGVINVEHTTMTNFMIGSALLLVILGIGFIMHSLLVSIIGISLCV